MTEKKSRNRSTTYILPLIIDNICLEFGVDDEFINKNLLNNLKDTYLFENKEIFFIFELNKNVDSLCTLELLQKSIFYVKHEVTDDYLVIFLDIPNELHDVVTKFLDGKYSKFSEIDKQSILSFAKVVWTPRMCERISQILYKDENYAKELASHLGIPGFEPEWELGEKVNTNWETYVSKSAAKEEEHA